MKKAKIMIVLSALVVLGLYGSNANAYGTIWCKVSLGTIQACFKTFDQCNYDYHLGECKPFEDQ